MIAARRTASPYARRLARERGIALISISGSGPDGRIVAADIEAFAANRAAAAPRQVVASSTVSAFAAIVSLEKLQKLLTDFGGARLSLTLDDMIIRAAALALEAVPSTNRSIGDNDNLPEQVAVGWETGGGNDRREVVLVNAHKGLVSILHANLAAGLSEPSGPTATSPSAALSVRRVTHEGIRPTAMPLLAGHTMRLIVSGGEHANTAECLLCFDADAVGEDAAAAFLARFRDDLEMPVRLLA
jgi:hypothetical protein